MRKEQTCVLMTLLVSFLIWGSFVPVASGECVLKMTYKKGDKLPMIAETPNNSGAYLELFDIAVKKIGCRLEVTRLPKKRLHVRLAKGTLDFYPGASFSKVRSKYLFYVDNGFLSGEYGLTLANVPELHNFQNIADLGLKWLMELGSSKTDIAKRLGIKRQEVRFVDIDRARQFFAKKRAQFYVVDKELVDYYPKRKKVGSFEEIGLKVHKNCCGGDRPMYLGFSRFSPHFNEKPNPHYDKTQPISQNNFPTMLAPGSTVYKLREALQELKKSGTTKMIYDKHFSN